MKRSTPFLLAAALAFAIGFVSSIVQAQTGLRFDEKVRNDFFAGFTGNKEAFDRAMKVCEEILAKEPKHPEAMVWHGGGVYWQAGQAFRAGDNEKGMQLYERGLKQMDDAVALAPDHVGVRIPRGAVMLSSTRFMPGNPEVPKLLERGLQDYERTLELQKARFSSLSEHSRGELLFGLAEGYSRAGDAAKAEMYFQRISKELSGTPYAKRAAIWLEKKTLPLDQTSCIGCHVKQ